MIKRACAAAATVTLLVALLALPAFAHTVGVSGSPVCNSQGQQVITWTVHNDYNSPMTISALSFTPAGLSVSGFAIGTLLAHQNDIVTGTTIAAADQEVKLAVNGLWGDGYTQPAPTTSLGVKPLGGCAVIHISKTALAPSVPAGHDIGFTVTVANPGTSSASAVMLHDPLPSGTGVSWAISPAYSGQGSCSVTGASPQVLGCSLGTLAGAASIVVHLLSHTTAASAPASTVAFNNTATATASNAFLVSATAVELVTPLPHLSITKTADATAAPAGNTIGFTVTLSNSGPGIAKTTVLNDPLPAVTGTAWAISPAYTGQGTCAVSGNNPSQTLACTLGDLAAGASVTVHVQSATQAAFSATLNNTATGSAQDNPPVTATATVVLTAAPGLHITKTADAPTATAGSPIGFTVTLSNAGPGLASNVVLSDPLPSVTGTSWAISPAYSGPGSCSLTGTNPTQTLLCHPGDLAAGTTVTVHVSAVTLAGTTAILHNIATASADNNRPVTATATLAVTPLPNGSVTPTVAAGVPTQVLGETFTRPVAAPTGGTLPITGGVALALIVPALVLVGLGIALQMARRRKPESPWRPS